MVDLTQSDVRAWAMRSLGAIQIEVAYQWVTVTPVVGLVSAVLRYAATMARLFHAH
jgi:hypothetical protein